MREWPDGVGSSAAGVVYVRRVIWDDLSAATAQAALTDWTATTAERLRWLAGVVEGKRFSLGPRPELEPGRESVASVDAWLGRWIESGCPALRRPPTPWQPAADIGETYDEPYPDSTTPALLDALALLLAASWSRETPALWQPCVRSSPIWADYQHPVAQHHDQAVEPLVVARNVVRNGWGGYRSSLLDLYDQVAERLANAKPGARKQKRGVPVRVYAAAEASQTHEVEFRDDIAQEHSDAVDDMVALLAAEPSVSRAWRDDRERVIVDAPWTVAEVRAWFRAACKERGL